ncbi:zinc-binding alcohol dehydrogenase family protein [Umezawaea endophytica]|uniref:Zinc-binding dehydrogenase n=1 Tax=Umezawaea endophytica TaxID=1654476 RepID=A0A9X3A3K8_9PSEU|nr:zinc-binding dehydrogenase [Umezawaea endophytica]MCS7481844.1 zinc-binding dehydrogenase [Umezawaea endophytica]
MGATRATLPGHEVVRVDLAGPCGVVGTTSDGRRVVALGVAAEDSHLVSAPERLLFPVPAEITDAQALVLAGPGVTAWHLLRTCAHLRPDEAVVVHDAASQVGALAVQLARSFCAGQVIAVADTASRRKYATTVGADVAVDADPDGLCDRLLAVNGGHPVDVVLSPVGGVAFPQSLAVLAPFGRMVVHGESPTSVAVGPIEGSRAVVSFWLGDCLGRPEMVARALSELMGLTSAGRLRPPVGDEYPLSVGARSNRARSSGRPR